VADADTFPDRPDGRATSALASIARPGTGDPPATEPGAIATWAWHLSRILDWLVTLPEIDAARVAVVGHSRLGKAALWAGARDARFAMVVSNESGCGGAALSRRNYGESVRRITSAFPHWFCPAFATYAGREAELPCDQHALLALVAPRPLYVASALDDRWADPRGEFIAAVAAEPAWTLHGRRGLGTAEWPAPDTPVYDIRFIAPRRDPSGAIVTSGRVTAWLNGRMVQNGVTFTELRSPYTPYKHGVTEHLKGIERRLLSTGEGPLILQDHGSPTRYRNVWIKPLGR
jgi:hypothetical protein